MTGAVSALLLLLPAFAFAQSQSPQEFSFISSFLQMLAALAIVIGLILVTWHLTGRLTRGMTTGRLTSRYIRVVETRYIAPKKALILVEVGGEYLLISSTDNSLTLIKHVDMLEEVEVVGDADDASSSSMAGIIKKMLRRT